MVSGFDRYFQIAPCFRDEDGRADRTPGEFYQLDVEMSFVTQDDVFAAMETLFAGVFAEFSELPITGTPFPRIPYKESMLRFGTDKPDLRIPIEIKDLTPLFAASEFKAFAGKTVRAMAVAQAFDQPRSWFDNLQEEAKKLGAAGLAYVKVEHTNGIKTGYTGPIAKFLNTPEIHTAMDELARSTESTVIFFSADHDENKAAKVLGVMREKIAAQLNLIEKDVFKFAWIVDYPMYELNDEKKIDFSHNPFSMPQGGLEALTTRDPLTLLAHQYDLVCNGYEMLSGAIRNHVPEIMYRAFEIAGYDRSVVDTKCPGMINAFKDGAPPHGGVGVGLDRIVMLLANETSIREVIAFPMAQNGRDLLMNAPSPVSEKQLRDVHLTIRKPVPKV
jgi:aspartyl-tRNA synthetase